MSSPERTLLKRLSRRTRLIEQVREGVGEKRELTERLDVSRATVDRAIRELESIGIVERTEEGYALTLLGELAYTEFRRLLDRFETFHRARELLSLLPREFGIDPAVLEDAEIALAEQPMPHEPLDRLEELIETHERISCYTPIAFPSLVDTVHRRITEGGAEIELFLDEPLVERLRASYDEELREALAAGNATLRQLPSDRGPGVVLALIDERIVWIGVHDDGNVRGSLTLESDGAREWAHERLDRCRELGEAIPSADPDAE